MPSTVTYRIMSRSYDLKKSRETNGNIAIVRDHSTGDERGQARLRRHDIAPRADWANDSLSCTARFS